MTEPLNIISLGAGVQSSTMALMAARGEITPMPDCAIFSDTYAEPASVYKWLDWLEKQLPFPVYRVTNGSLAQDAITIRKHSNGVDLWTPSAIPAYTLNQDGTVGRLPRQCTKDFKIRPIIKKCREIVGNIPLRAWRKKHRSAISALNTAKRLKAGPPYWAWKECQDDALIRDWMGISFDEVGRMKPSRDPWIYLSYPLIERRIWREDCLAWMEQHGYQKPPRSACVFCPFHNENEWLRLKTEEPADFKIAVEFDKSFRAAKQETTDMRSQPFLHRSCKPLDEIDFSSPNLQNEASFTEECEGMCGV